MKIQLLKGFQRDLETFEHLSQPIIIHPATKQPRYLQWVQLERHDHHVVVVCDVKVDPQPQPEGHMLADLLLLISKVWGSHVL